MIRMDFSKLPIRRLSTTINVFKNDRRTWKPYYNNRHGWQRCKFSKITISRNFRRVDVFGVSTLMTSFLAFEKYRSYYVREHDHKQILGAQMEAHGVDLDWRIRNKCPSVSIDFIYSLRVVCQQNIQNLQNTPLVFWKLSENISRGPVFEKC